MITTGKLAHSNFTQVLDQIASTAQAPGGGAAGALVVALGIACGTKAVRISAKHQPLSTSLTQAAAALQTLSSAVLELAAADGAAFEELLDAYKLPKRTPQEQQTRRATIAAAAVRAADVGQSIIDQAQRATAILDAIKDEIHPNLVSDFSAAHSLFAANHAIQQQNIDENRAIAQRFSS